MPMRSVGIVQRASGTAVGVRRVSSRTSVLASTLRGWPEEGAKTLRRTVPGSVAHRSPCRCAPPLASHSKAGKFRVVFYASLSPSTRSASMSFVRNRSGFECSRALAATASRKARSNSY